jgi:hypothetical protein
MDMALGGVGLGTGGATGMVGAITGGELVPVATSVCGVDGIVRDIYDER